MEFILFYGVPQGCSFGSIVALEWLQQPYRLCRINMPIDMQTEQFARINPVRETPALMLEDGRTLTQSAAILNHLAARDAQHSIGFAPGTVEHDRLNEVMAFLNTTFFASFSPLWRAYEMETNPPVQEMLRTIGRSDVARAHAQLDAMLGDRDWLVGNRRTIADAYLVGIARWATYHRALDQRDYPNLFRLLQKLDADPAVIFARAIEAQSDAQGAGGFLGHLTLSEIGTRLAA